MGRQARPTRRGNLLTMKQTEQQQLLMGSSVAYPRGKEGKSRNSKMRQNSKVDQTLGYLGVVNPVTPGEDVPLRERAQGFGGPTVCFLKQRKILEIHVVSK
ncbi:hypothetical protein AVEN_92164-1 [Araneus ventricosus]|uniref:Uncharacterized protein n=1 Tax=Araneus ventricosus TaxID=182803 RepID=A0A4Y2G854_ARAVE|nr:hypothetical protein AVEN_92164-1 [Araneus ventricosus]